ncbi:hypothetical protein SDC9_173415 [bioreactor metagenome]|uniref:Uncharacterized protein n=1 Tax=bioreactor metagenome TaxID=1076179 RepID=A0A645GQP3_9ZZZZ
MQAAGFYRVKTVGCIRHHSQAQFFQHLRKIKSDDRLIIHHNSRFTHIIPSFRVFHIVYHSEEKKETVDFKS